MNTPFNMYQTQYKGSKLVLRKKAAPRLVLPQEKPSFTHLMGEHKDVRMDSLEMSLWLETL